ncbi:MAG: YceD family protein [Sulfuricellaceae bacterium]
MSEQVVINSLEFAQQGKRLQGEIAVADLSRLQEYLHSSGGGLSYTLSGKIGENAKPYLVCTVQGELALQCQRCLDALAFKLDIVSTLELVENADDFLPLEGEEDSADAIPVNPAMDVPALVEEEVLLSLPIAPLHPLAECAAANYRRLSGLGEANPFGVLAKLKK